MKDLKIDKNYEKIHETFSLILEHCATHWGKLSTSFINWIFDGSLNLNFHAKNPDYDLKKGQNPINGQNIEVCPSVQKAVFMGFLRSVDKHKKEKRDRNVERYYLRAMFTFSKLKIRTKNCTFLLERSSKRLIFFRYIPCCSSSCCCCCCCCKMEWSWRISSSRSVNNLW